MIFMQKQHNISFILKLVFKQTYDHMLLLHESMVHLTNFIVIVSIFNAEIIYTLSVKIKLNDLLFGMHHYDILYFL